MPRPARRPSSTTLRHRRRRRMVVAGLAGLLLVACGGDDGDGDADPGASVDSADSAGASTPGSSVGSTVAGDPVDGGSLVFAIDTPLTRLDPNVAAAAQDARVMRQVYDSLVALDDAGEPVPWLATEWEISDDGLTYTFTLRDDVTFHDGSAFDAPAVCFNLDRIADPTTGSIFAIGAIGPYTSCEAPDPTTAVITLGSPYSPLLANLSSPFLGMISPAGLEAAGPDAFLLAPVGSGPFTFTSYTPDDRIILTRNADYAWGPANADHEGPAHLEQLTFQIIPDATVRLGSLRNGDVQAIGNVPETEVAGLEADESLGFVAQPQSGAPYQLFFNTQRGPWSDPAVRAAVRSALDIESITEALYFGAYERAWTPLSPTTSGYDTELEESWAFDAEAAGTALDEAGWVRGDGDVREKDGEQLTAVLLDSTPNREKRQDINVFVRDQLRAVGVAVEILTLDAAALQETLQAGEYDIAGLSLVNVDPNVMYTQYHSDFIPSPEGVAFNFAQVDDPDLDAALLAAQAELNPDARASMYAELQAEVIEQAYSVPVYVPTYTVGTNGLEGLRFDAEGYPVLYDSWVS